MNRFIDGTCEVSISTSPLEIVEEAVREFQESPSQHWYARDAFTRHDFFHRPIATFAEYRDGFAGANPEARAEIEREIERIRRDSSMPEPESIRSEACWHEDEGEIDMDRAFAGDDACFRSRRKARRRVATKNVTIVYDCVAHRSVTASDMMKSGAAVGAAVEILEAAGYSVELWVVMPVTACSEGGRGSMYVACRAKEAGEPLNTDVVANVFSPDLFRVGGYGLMSNSKTGRSPTQGRGYPDENLNRQMQTHLNLGTDKVVQCCVRDGLGYPTEQAKRIIREATEA